MYDDDSSDRKLTKAGIDYLDLADLHRIEQEQKMVKDLLPGYRICSTPSLHDNCIQTNLLAEELDENSGFTLGKDEPNDTSSEKSLSTISQTEQYRMKNVDHGSTHEAYLMPDFIGIKFAQKTNILLKDTKKTTSVTINPELLDTDEIILKVIEWPIGELRLSVGGYNIFPNIGADLPHYISVSTEFKKFSLEENMLYGMDPQHAERERAAWRQKERRERRQLKELQEEEDRKLRVMSMSQILKSKPKTKEEEVVNTAEKSVQTIVHIDTNSFSEDLSELTESIAGQRHIKTEKENRFEHDETIRHTKDHAECKYAKDLIEQTSDKDEANRKSQADEENNDSCYRTSNLTEDLYEAAESFRRHRIKAEGKDKSNEGKTKRESEKNGTFMQGNAEEQIEEAARSKEKKKQRNSEDDEAVVYDKYQPSETRTNPGELKRTNVDETNLTIVEKKEMKNNNWKTNDDRPMQYVPYWNTEEIDQFKQDMFDLKTYEEKKSAKYEFSWNTDEAGTSKQKEIHSENEEEIPKRNEDTKTEETKSLNQQVNDTYAYASSTENFANQFNSHGNDISDNTVKEVSDIPNSQTFSDTQAVLGYLSHEAPPKTDEDVSDLSESGNDSTLTSATGRTELKNEINVKQSTPRNLSEDTPMRFDTSNELLHYPTQGANSYDSNTQRTVHSRNITSLPPSVVDSSQMMKELSPLRSEFTRILAELKKIELETEMLSASPMESLEPGISLKNLPCTSKEIAPSRASLQDYTPFHLCEYDEGHCVGELRPHRTVCRRSIDNSSLLKNPHAKLSDIQQELTHSFEDRNPSFKSFRNERSTAEHLRNPPVSSEQKIPNTNLEQIVPSTSKNEKSKNNEGTSGTSNQRVAMPSTGLRKDSIISDPDEFKTTSKKERKRTH